MASPSDKLDKAVAKAIGEPEFLTRSQRELAAQPLRIPPGFGMRVLRPEERLACLTAGSDDGESDLLSGLYDKLLVWEAPRKGFLYVISVDVSNGIGLDSSVIDVTRVGTVREPDEQVAQFVTKWVEPDDLAQFIEPIGRLYTGRDQLPAVVAIECNGLGIGTQAQLQKRLGYPNLFIWQTLDARDIGKSFTQRIGWWTTPRSRPIILGRYYHAVKTVDPITGLPDYRINSPHTIRELQTFISPGPLWMAEAAEGAHDDCIMAGAIGVHIAQEMQDMGRETVHDTRKRLNEEAARMTDQRHRLKQPVTAQTTDVTYAEMMGQDDPYDHPTDPHMI